MATTLVHVNEDYIDMELISPSNNNNTNFFPYSIASPSPPPQQQQQTTTREFEFQMTPSFSSEKDSTTSPADDLFYKGKLLPLHLPPRLQMVQNLTKGGPVHEPPTTLLSIEKVNVRSRTPNCAEARNLTKTGPVHEPLTFWGMEKADVRSRTPKCAEAQNLTKDGPVHEPLAFWGMEKADVRIHTPKCAEAQNRTQASLVQEPLAFWGMEKADVRSSTPARAETQNPTEDSKCTPAATAATTAFEHLKKSFSSLDDTNFMVESCNISPVESCRVSSSDANPDEYLFGSWEDSSSSNNNNNNGNFVVGVGGEIPKKPSSSWPKKLKQIKQFWLGGQRVKSSRAYLKSLFTKSSCSDHKASCVGGGEILEKKNKYTKVFDDNNSENSNVDISVVHRRSFSGVLQRHCGPAKSSSSSSSSSTSSSGSCSTSSSFSLSSSAGYYDLQLFKRSISSSNNNCEVEGSIEGAIEHCKQSSQFASKIAVNSC